jgi:hypothetical protein
MSTYVLSYPRPGFTPVGATATDEQTAQRAYQQWLALCDHITRAGGRILVLDDEELPTDVAQAAVYSASIGAPFLAPGSASGPLFLRARRDDGAFDLEHDPICAALKRAGLSVQLSEHHWHGQAEVIALPRNRYLLTYGPHSAPESCDEVKRLLPLGAHVMCIQTTDSGLSALGHFTTKAGASLLLLDRSALRSHSPEDIGRFLIQPGMAGATEMHIMGREDIEACATQSLCVRGIMHMPPGVSTQLRGQMARLGFQSLVVDVSALFGPQRGGPRALCNEWPGFVLSDDSPSYATLREGLFARIDQYGVPASSAT